jgi:hypothetical protein
MGPFKAQGHRLGSPAPAGDSGWLVDFINACRADAECAAVQPDFITLHLYTTTAGVVSDYLVRRSSPIIVVKVPDGSLISSRNPDPDVRRDRLERLVDSQLCFGIGDTVRFLTRSHRGHPIF